MGLVFRVVLQKICRDTKTPPAPTTVARSMARRDRDDSFGFIA
jgi:hypothetical protein